MSIFERIRAWWQAPILQELERLRVQQVEHYKETGKALRFVMENHDILHGQLCRLIGGTDQRVEAFRTDIMVMLNAAQATSKEQHEAVIWRIAHLLSKTLGGSSEEWARPVVRLPRRFTLQERQ